MRLGNSSILYDSRVNIEKYEKRENASDNGSSDSFIFVVIASTDRNHNVLHTLQYGLQAA